MVVLAALSDVGWVFEAPDDGPFALGVNAPTVDWDGQGQRYVMFFESPLAPHELAPGCRTGWRIGRATSADGVTWEIDPEPVIEPEPGTAWACSASQPAVVRDGHDWHLLFAMEDDARNVGIGLARGRDGERFDVVAAPAIEGPRVGMPTVGLSEGLLHVVYVKAPDLAVATLDPKTGELLDTDVALVAADGPDWADHWLVTPALACVKHGGWGLVYSAFADPGATLRSYAIAGSDDGWAWSLEEGIAGLDVTHVDVTLTKDQTLVWYSGAAPDGRKAIGLAWTGAPKHKPKARECSVQPGNAWGTYR
ncbi:MAG: hypothetical protein ACOZNI_34380 [Myxococcota bacterium]